MYVCMYILFGHPEETRVFSKLQGLQCYFPKLLAVIKHSRTARKVRIFLIPLSITIF